MGKYFIQTEKVEVIEENKNDIDDEEKYLNYSF